MKKVIVLQEQPSYAPPLADGFRPFKFDTLGKAYANNDQLILEVILIPPQDNEPNVDRFLSKTVLPKLEGKQFDCIFIPASFGDAPLLYLGIRLAMHIRLTECLQRNRFAFIVLMGYETAMQINRLSYLGSFLFTSKVLYIQENNASVAECLAKDIPRVTPLTDEVFRSELFRYPVTSEPHLEQSHSLANEWGAWELDRFTVNVLKDADSELDASLYVKLLKQKINPEFDSSANSLISIFEFATGKSILYIDDEWHKGWKTVLQAIIRKAGGELTCLEELKKGVGEETTIELAQAKIKEKAWDLVILDLRLTDDDHSLKKVQNFTGERIIEWIKGNREAEGYNPALPVLVFTASTKAKNLTRLWEKGIDAYFIKPNPKDVKEILDTQESIETFLSDLGNCITKGDVLQHYWRAIQEITSSNLIQEKTQPATKFKERIQERLYMFLGLLRKAYEQTGFERQMFYFDQYETAYLTLWSILNDIVACYYDRESPPVTVEGKTQHDQHPSKPSISYPRGKYKWRDIFNGECFIKYENLKPKIVDHEWKVTRGYYQLTCDQVSPLGYSNNSEPYYEIKTESDGTLQYKVPQKDEGSKIDYQQSLANQTAFLVYAIAKQKAVSDGDRNKLWVKLKSANEQRNSLTLTHSNLLGSNYLDNFKQTIKQKRKNATGNESSADWQARNRDLFDVVFFLLTGRVRT